MRPARKLPTARSASDRSRRSRTQTGTASAARRDATRVDRGRRQDFQFGRLSRHRFEPDRARSRLCARHFLRSFSRQARDLSRGLRELGERGVVVDRGDPEIGRERARDSEAAEPRRARASSQVADVSREPARAQRDRRGVHAARVASRGRQIETMTRLHPRAKYSRAEPGADARATADRGSAMRRGRRGRREVFGCPRGRDRADARRERARFVGRWSNLPDNLTLTPFFGPRRKGRAIAGGTATRRAMSAEQQEHRERRDGNQRVAGE